MSLYVAAAKRILSFANVFTLFALKTCEVMILALMQWKPVCKKGKLSKEYF